MAEQYVYLYKLAEHLGRERSTFKRRIVKGGYRVVRIRNLDSGQEVDAIAADDARKIIAAEKARPVFNVINPEDLVKED